MSKLFFASDLHGDLTATEAILAAFGREGADHLILLGDLLYHGPRNDLPKNYQPKAVIDLLNRHADRILAVRGNCDSEVDQMVLNFPILADYAMLFIDGISIYVTHGHHANAEQPPYLAAGDVLICGHTHVAQIKALGDANLFINPGSPAIPKENTPRGYLIYEAGIFTLKTLESEAYAEQKWGNA